MTRVLTEWLGAMVDYFSGLWICDGLRVGVRLLVQRHQPLGPDAKRLWKLGSDRNLATHSDLDSRYATPRTPPRKESDPETSFLNRRNFDPQAGQGA